jgi:O-antigen/teichoic acid export membrane protein
MIALSLADIPRAVVSAVSSKVIFPTFSRFTHLPRDELRARIQRNRTPLLCVIAPSLATVAVFGDYAVHLLFDPRYSDAGWIVPVLAIGVWPLMLAQTLDPALFAVGKPRVIAFACLFSFITVLLGILVGKMWQGPVGAVVGIAMKSVPFYIIANYGLWRERLACLGQDLWATMFFVACLTMVYGCRLGLGFD